MVNKSGSKIENGDEVRYDCSAVFPSILSGLFGAVGVADDRSNPL